MGKDSLVLVGHFAARKGCPVYSVPSRSAADHHNQISCFRIIEAFAFVYQADVAAIDQRISQVSVVEVNRTVDRWYSHSVAVITNARHNAFHNSFRMQEAFGNVFEFFVRLAEAKYICVGDGSGTQTGCHWVTNYTAYAGSGSAVRVKCRGVIMGFDLETYR